MRISDWSSDVCSSDLAGVDKLNEAGAEIVFEQDAGLVFCVVGIFGQIGGRRSVEYPILVEDLDFKGDVEAAQGGSPCRRTRSTFRHRVRRDIRSRPRS